ncbi:phage tail tape measure protein [Psychromonas sp. SR45-3]|nr:phage tail tape measure protein [Psychromonas sp. SR45-3]
MTDRLMMHIGVIDQVTRPLRGITSQMQTTMDAGRRGMSNMVTGGAGLVASGLAIQSALMPAIEMDRKMGEVASLGVTDDALKQLQNTALEFSAEYGKSATDFVAASYDIQSAIAGLDGNELSQFTKASGVLAAATKADTGTITNYMGTMYGIFKNQANDMGKGEWVEQVAGMTASAVQMFKTTGSEMSSAFTSIGAEATSFGIGMNEQMAILGTLQATMSGSEAGTKYRAFLNGAAKAQDALNLSFTDSQGQMLPMIEILEQLKGRYGDTIDVAESAELAKAFGTKEATGMIKLLMADTDGLAQSIETLGQTQGMGKAEEMASKMTDQWERMEATFFAVRAAVFGAILPAINAVVGTMADGLMTVVGWVQEFPLLGEVLGWVAVGVASLTGLVGALTLASGLATVTLSGLAIAFSVLTGPVLLGVAVIAGAVTAIWSYWDRVSAFVGGFIDAFVRASGVSVLFYPLIDAFKVIGDLVSWAFGWISSFLPAMNATGDALNNAASAGELFGGIVGGAFSAIIYPIKKVLSAIDWLLDKLNLIPGVSIDVGTEFSELDKMTANMAVAPEVSGGWSSSYNKTSDAGSAMFPYKQPQNKASLPPGMVANATTVNKQQAGNNRTYGDITVNTTAPFSLDYLEEASEFNAG